jgi:cytochrome c553
MAFTGAMFDLALATLTQPRVKMMVDSGFNRLYQSTRHIGVPYYGSEFDGCYSHGTTKLFSCDGATKCRATGIRPIKENSLISQIPRVVHSLSNTAFIHNSVSTVRKHPPDLIMWILAGVVLSSVTLTARSAAQVAQESPEETGRRIYEQGLLPDNSALRAVRPEGFEITGQAAACITCHRRSGMGSVEGNLQNTILVPPIVKPILFAPSRFADAFLDRSHYYVPNEAWARVLTRHAYDEQSFARALREGVDPDGKQLVAPMMQYHLDDAAMSALSAYLQTLTQESAPGVDTDTLHLATVVSPEVSVEQSEAVLAVLRSWSAATRVGGRTWTLHVWRLTGAPTTWGRQLEAFYLRHPVFALLSGSGLAHWNPVHLFCENNHIPCILPSTEVVTNANEGYYSVYFSSGVNLEAQILAVHLREMNRNPQSDSRIIQVYTDASGHHAAQSLHQALEGGKQNLIARRYLLTAPPAALRDTLPVDTLILWLRPAEVQQLVAGFPEGPPAQHVYLSALLAAPERVTLPPSWRPRVTWVSLFDDIGVQGEIAKLRLTQWLRQRGLEQTQDTRQQADAYVASYLFQAALMEMVSQEHRRPAVPLNREYFLETLETLINKYGDGTAQVDPDSHIAFYGRMSLGPRQRSAVRGGTMLRFRAGDANKLEPVSERIVPQHHH